VHHAFCWLRRNCSRRWCSGFSGTEWMYHW